MKNNEITALWLNQRAKEIHANAVAKGFYDDAPARTTTRFADAEYMKRRVNLIFGELGEFYEAMRSGKVKPVQRPTAQHDSAEFAAQYVAAVKGTAEEELADVVIRVLDLVASLGDTVSAYEFPKAAPNAPNTLDSAVFYLYRDIAKLQNASTLDITAVNVLRACIDLATYLDVNLPTAILEKMAYNKTRPHKHGKKF